VQQAQTWSPIFRQKGKALSYVKRLLLDIVSDSDSAATLQFKVLDARACDSTIIGELDLTLVRSLVLVEDQLHARIPHAGLASYFNIVLMIIRRTLMVTDNHHPIR